MEHNRLKIGGDCGDASAAEHGARDVKSEVRVQAPDIVAYIHYISNFDWAQDDAM